MIFLNQAVRQYFTTGISHDSVDTIILKYKTPEGDEGFISSGINVDVAATGTYYVDLANEFLDVLGTWQFWAEIVDIDDNIFPGTPFTIEVIEEGIGNYPVTREQIKSFLKITDTTQDADIDALIPVMIEQYRVIRNAPYDSKNGVTIYPAGFEYALAKMYEYLTSDSINAASEHIGNYSITYKAGTAAYPPKVTCLIKKFVRGV